MNVCARSLMIYIIIALILSISFLLAQPYDQLLPPYFNEGEEVKTLKLVLKEGLNISCNFSDSLDYELQWFNNEKPYENKSKTLFLKYDKKNDNTNDNYYWCTIKNEKGISRSGIYDVKHYKNLDGIISIDEESEYIQNQYQKFQSKKVDVFPPGTSTWVKSETHSQSQHHMTDDRHTYTDAEGNLHITKLEFFISKPTFLVNSYKLSLKDNVKGIAYYNVIQKADRELPLSTSIMFYSGAEIFRGEDASLECFFSLGKNEKNEVSWRKEGDRNPLNATYSPFKWRATIKNAQKEDSGAYICSIGDVNKTVNLIVNERVSFYTPDSYPRNQNVTVGDTVRVPCLASGTPPLTIGWYINQVEINENAPGISYSDDKRVLVVREACAYCPERSRKSDTMVVSCRVENKFDTIFASGYINVLNKTEVKLDEKDMEFETENSKGTAVWNCTVEHDATTPATVFWKRVMNDEFSAEILQNDGKGLSVNGGYLKITVGSSSEKNWNFYKGTYECYSTNGYSNSSKRVHVRVLYDSAELAFVSKAWWMFILFFILVFFLVLLIVACCLYAHYNKEFTYYVDLHERMNGNDPVKELENLQFADYTRKEVYSSRHTLNSVDEDGEEDEEHFKG